MSQLNPPHSDLSLTGVRRLYETAVEHFDAGDFGQAETYLEWLIEREPRHGHAYWYMARVKEQRGRLDDALFYWKTCALLNDGRLDWVDGVYTKLAEHYLRTGRHEEFYQFLLEAARRDTGCPNIQRQLALTAERLGRKQEAIQHLLQCLKLNPDPDYQQEIQDQLMNLCFELGDLDLLREAGRSLLATDPSSARAHYLLSRYYEKRGHLTKALSHLRKSAKGDWQDRGDELPLELAALYKKAGRPREALRTLTRGRMLDDNHAFALWLAAECFEEMGEAPQALTMWRRAAEAFGAASREGREAFFAYIEALIDLGREEEAKNQLERSPEAIRSSERAQRYLAEAHERIGDLEVARGIWETVLQRCPAQTRERAGPLMSLARILMGQGEAERALALLENEDLEALHDAELFALLAEVHEDLGQEEKALLSWDRAEALVRHDRRRAFELRLARAELLLRISRAEDAVALLEVVVPRHGQEERYYGLFGQALAEVGEHDRALAAWEELSSSPRPRVRREGLLQSARLLRDLGRPDEAATLYERLISEGNDMRAGLLGLAEIAEERRDYSRAQSLWDALAEMYENVQALSSRARSRARSARAMMHDDPMTPPPPPPPGQDPGRS